MCKAKKRGIIEEGWGVMQLELLSLGSNGLWVIKSGSKTLCVCGDDDLKAFAEQIKEAGF